MQEAHVTPREIIPYCLAALRNTRSEKLQMEEGVGRMELTYRKATTDDAELLLDIYNASFYDDYIRYGECPGYGKTKAEMEAAIETSSKYIVLYDTDFVGVISVIEKEKEMYELNCLCVLPAYQGMGIGTQAFQYMLTVCPNWKQITLVTPADQRTECQLLYKELRVSSV
ncbi:MAG: N-acetyltransferase family protein [[Clostridium] innocuum]